MAVISTLPTKKRAFDRVVDGIQRQRKPDDHPYRRARDQVDELMMRA